MIYIAKIYTRLSEAETKEVGQKLRLWDAKLYKSYEYAVGSITSGDPALYERLPMKYHTDFSRPHITSGSSTGAQGFVCDLEFHYEDTGVVVYIGEPLLEDDAEPESGCAKALKAAFGI